MADIFLPILHSFVNENIFTGSCGSLRFRIAPQVKKLNKKEVDFANSSIKCELWRGQLCYELSQIEQEKTVPLTEEGRAEIKAWLEENS
ncbi:MAG: hypothetical protein LBM28_03225 [Oscillospiraceae bacterium]|jgi:hypothetical protein|nr:hypothetical protein [Oscillospiraceae bacterium]